MATQLLYAAFGNFQGATLAEPGPEDKRRGPTVDENPLTTNGTGDAPPPARYGAGEATDFDTAWKDALTLWLPDCLRLFWPIIHDQINWAVAPVFLNKELRNLQKAIKPNARHVDQLVEVQFKIGHRALLLIHIEVQARTAGQSLALRMLRYHNRLFETYPKHAHFPCAILLDRKHGPDIESCLIPVLGGEHIFRFPVVNLAAWSKRREELHTPAPTNPFAVVVLAQLACRATRPDQRRLVSKLELAKLLKHWGYDENLRFNLMLIIDALLTLPEALEENFYDAALQTEDEHTMERLNSFQRVRLRRERQAAEAIGLQKGIEQGIEQGLLKGEAQALQRLLTKRFGQLPDSATQRIASATADQIDLWIDRVLDAQSLNDVLRSS